MTLQPPRRHALTLALLFVAITGWAAFAQSGTAAGQSTGIDTAAIDRAIGRSGQATGDVYKVTFPRSDLHVTTDAVAVKVGLALTGWAAFKAVGSEAVVHGDLAVTEAEVNPVVGKLRAEHIEVTAIHNHLLGESPRVMYVHFWGRGPAPGLASSLRAALAVTATPAAAAPVAANEVVPEAEEIQRVLGLTGSVKGGVLSLSKPRPEQITMMGVTLPPAMGMATGINIQAAEAGKVASTGDFVLTGDEVNPVISALTANGIEVTALHNHMIHGSPELYFMHFWAHDSPARVAAGLKAALAAMSGKAASAPVSMTVSNRPSGRPARAAAVALTAATPQDRAAPMPPALPAERLFRAWLAAFDRGNRDELLAFFRDHFPARAKEIDGAMEFREDTGGFDLVRIETVTDTRLTAIMRERAGDQFARAEVEVEAGEPHRIVRMGIQVVPRPAEFAVARLSQAQLVPALEKKLDEDAAAGTFSGSVLVARHGKAIFSGARGTADREKGTPNTLDTRFRMGSMNKMFTATAVLQLVQAGKVALDAPIGRYLADYPNQDVAAKVTVHHLLTHTGGTGDIFTPEYDQHRLDLRTLQDYVGLYGRRPLRFEPGSKWEYSNYGFILAGLIVERVSGQSYYDYVRDHIFAPAGMTSTGSEPEEQAVPNRAKGYMRSPGGLKPNTDTLPYRGTSAGGGYTTVGDLLRFATALTGHTLLDARHTELLTSGKVDTGRAAGDRYAYGFIDSTEFGGRSIGHGGGAPGMNGELRIFPASGYVVAALVNADSGASRMASWIGARLPE